MICTPPNPMAYQIRKKEFLDYCQQCGVTEESVSAASIGWGNKERTICRPCSIHNEIDIQIRNK